MARTGLTKGMQRIEDRFGRPVREVITTLTFEYGITGAAEKIGVHKNTLENYIHRLGMHVERVVYHKDDQIRVVKNDGSRSDAQQSLAPQKVV